MTRQRRRTLIFWSTVLILFVGAIAWGLRPKAIPVDTAEVAQGPLQITVDEEGKTRLRDAFAIRAPVAATARRITLEEGDAVRRGQPLVMLDPLRSPALDPSSRAQAEARLRAARAALRLQQDRAKSAGAQAALAAEELRRTETLYRQGAVSKQALDRADASQEGLQAAADAARHAVEVARLEAEAARTALTYAGRAPRNMPPITLYAPVDGRVIRVLYQSEGPVQPGQDLLVIGNPGQLEVAVEVLSDDAVRIAPGMRVALEGWGGERALEGRVRTVEPGAFTKISALGVEEQRVRVIADITSPPTQWTTLGDGYRVLARLILWEGDVLQIPRSALFSAGGDMAVFVLAEGRAVQRNVKLGRAGGYAAQVVGGLRKGEQVIIHPDQRIQDGSRVTMRENARERPEDEPATPQTQGEAPAS